MCGLELMGVPYFQSLQRISGTSYHNDYSNIRLFFFSLAFCLFYSTKCKDEYNLIMGAGLGGSVGCAIRLETRRSRVKPPPRPATFFRGD